MPGLTQTSAQKEIQRKADIRNYKNQLNKKSHFATYLKTGKIQEFLGIKSKTEENKAKWEGLKDAVLESLMTFHAVEKILDAPKDKPLQGLTTDEEFDLVVQISELPELQCLTDSPIKFAKWFTHHAGASYPFRKRMKDAAVHTSGDEDEEVEEAGQLQQFEEPDGNERIPEPENFEDIDDPGEGPSNGLSCLSIHMADTTATPLQPEASQAATPTSQVPSNDDLCVLFQWTSSMRR